jgi:membrane fusion protein, multidrug efflux system
VKILLDANGADAGDLRPGMSVIPSIDTKTPDGATRTADAR